jgi:CRP/FNR family transcriptional regulator
MLTPFQNRARRALTECPFFGALSDESMRWVHRASVQRGEVLFEKGEPSNALFGLVSGQAKLFAEDENARQISFGVVGPGELVGDVGITSGAPRHASVVALAPCELASIKHRDLDPLLEENPALREALAHAAADAALRLSARIEDAAFLSVEARVEKALVDFAQRFGERIEDGICVALRQQDIADVLGLSRESVSRVLTSGVMGRRVRLARGRIVLLGD